jgi:hypothetical protein
MFGLLHLFLALILGRLKSRRRLEIENLYLRHQLNIGGGLMIYGASNIDADRRGGTAAFSGATSQLIYPFSSR